MKTAPVTLKLRIMVHITLTLWQAIKLRIAGKGFESIAAQITNIIKIDDGENK